MPTKLKPCPFCGMPPHLVFSEGILIGVECANVMCHIQSHTSGLTEKDAITAWNRRAKEKKNG